MKGSEVSKEMANNASLFSPVKSTLLLHRTNTPSKLLHHTNAPSQFPSIFPLSNRPPPPVGCFSFGFSFRQFDFPRTRRKVTSLPAVSMLAENPVVGDVFAAAISGGIALSVLRFWAETAKRGIFDQVDLRVPLNYSLFCLFEVFCCNC